MIAHTDDDQKTCDSYVQNISQSSDLSQHKLIHADDQPFTCGICGTYFTLLASLNTHTCMHIHTRDKPYTCDDCGKCFTKSFSLRRHTLIHTGDKPYTCDTCEKVLFSHQT